MEGVVLRTRIRLAVVLSVLTALLPVTTAAPANAVTGDMVISGVVDGPLTGGIPKAIELYVVNPIPDLSIYGVGSANNGGVLVLLRVRPELHELCGADQRRRRDRALHERLRRGRLR